MKQITAYEVEGKLFKTEQEARQRILEKKLTEHFRSKDTYDMLRKIIGNKETRDFLIEAFKECDQTEAESSETVNDDLLARELKLESAKQNIQLDPKRIEAIKGPIRAFLGVGEYNNPGNQAYVDGFVLRDLQSKYSPVEIQEARRQIREEEE